MIRFKLNYFFISILLLVTEILIAIFAKDNFIRPFFGDYLAVIYLFFLFYAFLNWSKNSIALLVIFIAFLLEGLQYINFLSLVGLEKYKLIRILLGNSFSWLDILAYIFGVITVLLIFKKLK